VDGGALRRSVNERLRTGDAVNGWPPTWRGSMQGMVCLLDDLVVKVEVWIEPCSVI